MAISFAIALSFQIRLQSYLYCPVAAAFHFWNPTNFGMHNDVQRVRKIKF